MRSAWKRPDSPVEIAFDFSRFVADAGADEISFELRAQVGIEAEVLSTGEQVVVRFAGGTVGRQYRVGVEAYLATGEAIVQMGLVRVREVQDWPDIVIDPDGSIFLGDSAVNFNDLQVVLT